MDQKLTRPHLEVAVELVERTGMELAAERPLVAKHVLHCAAFYLQCAKMEPTSDGVSNGDGREAVIAMLDETVDLLRTRVDRKIARLPPPPAPAEE